MCKCKKLSDAANLVTSAKTKGNSCVYVTVNVTNIVKYVAIAGIAIVGIIFGTKCFIEYSKTKEKEEE